MPVARPTKLALQSCTLNADLHTSLLFTTTDGAFAVGGALSVTTVDDTVFVFLRQILKMEKEPPKALLMLWCIS